MSAIASGAPGNLKCRAVAAHQTSHAANGLPVRATDTEITTVRRAMADNNHQNAYYDNAGF